MRKKKINTTSLAAKEYVYLARRFNNRASSLARGTRYKFYDGTLFKTTASAKEIATTVLVLPVYMLALNITSRNTDDFINARAANLRDVEVKKISRDVFYAPEDTEELDIGGIESATPAAIPEPTAYGDPMPEGTESSMYAGFTGRRTEGYVTLRATQAFDSLVSRRGLTPFVEPPTEFWVEVVVCLGGDRFRRLTFSEAWVRQYAPGHDLVSRSNRYRLTLNYISACSNGRLLALTVPVNDALPFNPTTNNYDTGVCNALTFCLDLRDLDEEGRPKLLWTSFWDRRNDNDLRTAPYRLYPESPYDEVDYSMPPAAGTLRNTVVDTLEMDDTGIVFGIRMISTCIKLPEFRTADIDYDTDIHQRPVGGQLTQYVEWSLEGAPSTRILAQGCEAGLYYYQQLQAEGQLEASVKNAVLSFLEAYGAQNEVPNSSGSTGVTLYAPRDVGLGYEGDVKFLFLPGLNYYTGVEQSGEPLDLSDRKLGIASNSTHYVVIRKEGPNFLSTAVESVTTSFESVNSRPSSKLLSSIPGFDKDGFYPGYSNMNIRLPRTGYVGAGAFVVPATRTAVTSEVSMLIAFMSMDGYYTRDIPGVSNVNDTVGDESVRTIQEEIPDSDPNEPPTPCVLALTDDSGAYISNDGGLNWVRVITGTRYRDLAYISNKFVVRPFNKSEPVT